MSFFNPIKEWFILEPGSVKNNGYSGPERRRAPIHPWRWRLLTLWIILFTFVNGWSIRSQRSYAHENRNSINELSKTKSDIAALQKTNCGLKTFLFASRRARKLAVKTDKGALKAADKEAIRNYTVLLGNITAVGNHCDYQKK